MRPGFGTGPFAAELRGMVAGHGDQPILLDRTTASNAATNFARLPQLTRRGVDCRGRTPEGGKLLTAGSRNRFPLGTMQSDTRSATAQALRRTSRPGQSSSGDPMTSGAKLRARDTPCL